DRESKREHGRGGERGTAPQTPRGLTNLLAEHIYGTCFHARDLAPGLPPAPCAFTEAFGPTQCRDRRQLAQPEARPAPPAHLGDPRAQHVLHRVAVLAPERRCGEPEQPAIDRHDARSGNRRRRRAVRTSASSRAASAAATLRPCAVSAKYRRRASTPFGAST